MKNRIFGGYVISILPKLGEMLGGLHLDLWVKNGPLSALQSALRRGPRIFVLGADPKPEVVFPKFFIRFCRSQPSVKYGEGTKSMSYIVKEKS